MYKLFAAVVLGSTLLAAPAAADTFMQAHCTQHRVEWRGPRRSSSVAFADAEAHNRAFAGHAARVVLVAHESGELSPTAAASR